ncbi:hypothetical protein IV71_GL000273 [Fructobacillus fructosus KCTC 3544]|nr:hypothetical protein IV71_GL000273 [Fructobacillus fructosus KCTC 3544]
MKKTYTNKNGKKISFELKKTNRRDKKEFIIGVIVVIALVIIWRVLF